MSALYYTDELVTLYHGDCLGVTEWLAADVLVTDPPYGISWSLHGENKNANSRGHDGIANDSDTSYRDEVLKQFGNKPGVIFGSWRAPFPKMVQTLVWRKPVDAGVIGSVTGFRLDTELIFLTGPWPKRKASLSSVLVTDTGKRAYLNGHPHTKPVPLMQKLIAATSGVVSDPFAGSGSTLIAAKLLGRPAVGVEIDEPYCELIAKRLSQQAFDLGDIA